jgi:hypothetical protein
VRVKDSAGNLAYYTLCPNLELANADRDQTFHFLEEYTASVTAVC